MEDINNDTNLIVIRADHNINYKIINLTCIEDKNLSWKAKGIFNYFITRPPRWKMWVSNLKNTSTEGISALNAGIKELIEYGYLFRIVKRVNGKIVEWAYLSSEIPSSKEEITSKIPEGYILYERKLKIENLKLENLKIENLPYNKKNSFTKEESINNEESLELSSKEESNEPDGSCPVSSSTILHKRSKGQKLMNAKLTMKPSKEKKPVKPYEASSKAEHLMKYWKERGLHIPGVETQSYRDSLIAFDRLLSGKAFNSTEYENYENKKIDIKDARKAIERFAYMALNPDYEPRNIKVKKTFGQTSPHNFIFNPYKPVNGYGRSMFITCLENEPKLIREKDIYVEDKYPTTSTAVAKQFKEKILGGVDIKFTNDDINCFRKASNFATDLFKDNKKRLLGTYANMEPFRIAKCLFDTLESSNTDMKKVRPHWLCNSNMQTAFRAYLYQSGIIQDIDCTMGKKSMQFHNFGAPFEG